MRFLSLVLLLLLFSCGQESVENVGAFPFILNDQTLKIVGDDVELSNGSYTFLSNEIEVMKGNYEDGQKIGNWKYRIGEKNLELDWSVFTENSRRFSFSYPSAWSLPSEQGDIDLLIKTDKKDNNLQLIIYEHELDSILELQSYFEQYLYTLNNNYGDVDVEAYKITEKSNDFYYLNQ